jgi:hypothetical protein
LTAFLRREAIGIYDSTDLATKARVWLIDPGYLLPTEREIRRQTIRALRYQENVLFETIVAATDEARREAWSSRLLEPAPDGEVTRLEWLWTPPTSKQPSELEDHLAKVNFLRELGADRLKIKDLPLAGREHFHRRVTSRKPAALPTIREPRRTLELACFLRLQLMRLTDTALDTIPRKLRNEARDVRQHSAE